MKLSDAILATLAYHDIFDYTLTLEEVHRYLIEKKASLNSVNGELIDLTRSKKLGFTRGFYYLKNRQQIVTTRLSRARYSQPKLCRARFYSKLLTPVPTIKLVAISGALAMQNSTKGDDIDLVIVTSRHTLWTTRFLANLILAPFKRDPRGQKVTNRACLNIFIDEQDPKIKDQNIYTAHELCQLLPLLDRNKTYSRLIRSNSWIGKYLPNWKVSSEFVVRSSWKFKLPTTNYLLQTVEILLKKFQLWYMRERISTERIGKHQLFFHPSDTQNRVLKEYKKRTKRLGIIASHG